MAKHEFGIMKTDPIYEKRYDEYEPFLYDCIAIHDDFIEPLLTDLEKMDCYWHSLQVHGTGLAYCGITLIPPKSLETFKEILARHDNQAYEPLITLIDETREKQKFLIHFGI